MIDKASTSIATPDPPPPPRPAQPARPADPQPPYINWPAPLDMLGEANNIPDLAKMLLNPMGLQVAQAQVMPGQRPEPDPTSEMGLPQGLNPSLATGLHGGPARLTLPQPPASPVGVAPQRSAPVASRPVAGQL